MNVFAELRRRNVIRMAGLYLVAAWLLTQVASTILPLFEAPAWIARTVVVVLAIGFVPALALAWLFELTPAGLKRDADVAPQESIAPQTARRMNRLIMVVLVLALAYLGIDKFVLAPLRDDVVAAHATAAPAGASTQSIAVLPFVNMSSDKEQDYFSDGLSEELLNQLAQVPQLRVIARTSSFSFKGKEVDVATIAKALDVANVLEGSVRKSGTTLRVTAQLVRASDSSHLWSRTYDRSLTDVFKVQDEISGEVVEALKIRLLPAQRIANTQRTRDAAAYDRYLVGVKLQTTGGEPAAQQSVEAFQRAVAIDPHYANAYAGLSLALATLADFGESPTLRQGSIAASIDAADKAISLAPDLPDGYASRGNTRYRLQWDWSGAQADLQRALAIDPKNVDTLSYYGPLLFLLGHPEEALSNLRIATAADPLSALAWATLGRHLAADGQVDEARDALQRAIRIKPDQIWASFLLGNLELDQGRTDIAMSHYAHAPDQFRLAGTAMAQYTRGDRKASDAALSELESRYTIGFAFQIAQAHAWRGEKDAAFDWLERAFELHDGGMARLKYDPGVASLRGDPRFAALVQKMRFTE